MADVTVSRLADQLIAVKQVSLDRSAELKREAELLKKLRHPQVVNFVDITETADGGQKLYTSFVSSDTWATRPISDPVERTEGMAALAAVIADIHALGITHRNLTANHVMYGENDRPVICSFTRAGDISTENVNLDLCALADLMHDSQLDHGHVTSKLASLSDDARSGLLNAKELTQQLDRLLAQISAKRTQRGAKQKRKMKSAHNAEHATQKNAKSKSGSLHIMSGTSAVVAVLIAGGAVLIAGGLVMKSQHGRATENYHSTTATNSSIIESPHTVETRITVEPTPNIEPPPNAEQPSTTETHPTFEPTPNVEHTGITELTHTNIVEYQGRRYSVGVPGDIVVTGDWNCNGVATPAIARISSGEVALAEAWPDPDMSLEMELYWRIDGLTHINVVTSGEEDDTCDVLRAYTSRGSQFLNPAAT